MHRIFLFVFVSLALMSTSVWGEFYKYLDKEGNVHFTDDYNQVPMDQRENVKGYEEHVPEENTPSTASGAPAEAEPPDSAVNKNRGGSGLDAKMQELDRRKAELAREYEVLVNENERLAEVKKNIQTTEDAAQYNEQIRQLNARIKAHDQKRKQWFEDVEAYNSQVAEQSQK
jgi:small-conductance mechanosensitive channel